MLVSALITWGAGLMLSHIPITFSSWKEKLKVSFWNALKGRNRTTHRPLQFHYVYIISNSHYNHCQNNRFAFVLCSHYNLEWGIRILMPYTCKELEPETVLLWPFQYSVNRWHSSSPSHPTHFRVYNSAFFSFANWWEKKGGGEMANRLKHCKQQRST